ncbi:MAG: Clp protease N-terminal domain-containing protein [Actinomycetota bacterium]
MFEEFTDRARKVAVLAQEEAGPSRFIQSHHLLLAILTEGQSVAASALVNHDIQRETVLRLAREQHAAEDHDPDLLISFSAVAIEAINLARSQMRALSHEFIAPEHLLLGLVALENGMASSVLGQLSTAGLRDEVIDQMTTAVGVPGHLGACGRCGASIVNFGKVEEVALHVEDRSDINVYAYFCGECKSTYGLVKGSLDDTESA